MEDQYGVYFGTKMAGKVQVQRQGLYYRFHCRCQLAEGMVCRLTVLCGDKQENLGILVPMEGGFGLDTRIPAKRLGEGEMEFFLIPKHSAQSGIFVPIYPEEPFAYIARLKEAYLVKQNGQAGILLK